MEAPKICLTLTGSTLQEDINLIEKYRKYIDLVELRVDYLTESERLKIREFPSMAGLPCVLTIRREIDGGKFLEGEAARTILFAMALSFADGDRTKNFEYVDFEEDFHIQSLEEAAMAFGTKIIRSVHSMNKPIHDICNRLKELNSSGYEIPKIAFMPHSLDDVKNLFLEAEKLEDNNHILIAMGKMGIPTRVLAGKLKNYMIYTSAPDKNQLTAIGHIDPVKLNEMYHIKQINDETKLYGITGWPLEGTSSPGLHNKGYATKNLNAVYVPFPAETFSQAFDFAKTIGIEGMSVTVPHKEHVLDNADFIDETVRGIGASNTFVCRENKWFAFNTDAEGFSQSLLEFLGEKNLNFRRVAIIGAGGAARAIAYAVKQLHGRACIFNRTIEKAKKLANLYGFKYAPLNAEGVKMLRKYSDIIIQTTSKGMHSTEKSNEENDPIYFYEFSGKEKLFDIIYMPEITPVMARAAKAGCRVCNGYDMLRYQGYMQFEIFTGNTINKEDFYDN